MLLPQASFSLRSHSHDRNIAGIQILLCLSASARDLGCFPRFLNNSMQNTPRDDFQRTVFPLFLLCPASKPPGCTGMLVECYSIFLCCGHCYSALCFHERCIPWWCLKLIFLLMFLTCQSRDITCSPVMQEAQICFTGNTPKALFPLPAQALNNHSGTSWRGRSALRSAESFRQVKRAVPQSQSHANLKHC